MFHPTDFYGCSITIRIVSTVAVHIAVGARRQRCLEGARPVAESVVECKEAESFVLVLSTALNTQHTFARKGQTMVFVINNSIDKSSVDGVMKTHHTSNDRPSVLAHPTARHIARAVCVERRR